MVWAGDAKPDQPAKGIAAATQLHGIRYGRFDGPSMGMYTGHMDESQWVTHFGVFSVTMWERLRRRVNNLTLRLVYCNEISFLMMVMVVRLSFC